MEINNGVYMKELVCDMCGSNEIIKQDGLFVCQACNTKYSIEEARKMMFGEVVEVEGTVKIDNSTKLSNLYELARRAYDTGDTEYAIKYYEEILLIDPNSWEAQFFVDFSRLLNDDNIDVKKIERFNSSINSSISIVKDELMDDDEKTSVLASMTNEIIDISSKIIDETSEYIKSRRTSSPNIVGDSFKVLFSTSNLLFSYGDSIVDINEKSSNFAIGCWETAIELGASFNYLFDRSNKEYHKNIMEDYVQKIKKYNPQYEMPRFKKDISRIFW